MAIEIQNGCDVDGVGVEAENDLCGSENASLLFQCIITHSANDFVNFMRELSN